MTWCRKTATNEKDRLRIYKYTGSYAYVQNPIWLTRVVHVAESFEQWEYSVTFNACVTTVTQALRVIAQM